MNVENIISDSLQVKKALLQDEALKHTIRMIIQVIIDGYRNGNKVLLCGNGGSAADAQHIAGELSGKLYIDRPPLHAEALHVNTSYLTAVANDIGYDQVYARAVEAKGEEGDILICLSTSGASYNVIAAATQARNLGLTVVALTGSGKSDLSQQCDHTIHVPSDNVARIQEAHILIGHIICEIVEKELFPN